MFQTLQNTISIRFQLVPDGPIQVRAQSVGLDPGVADMEFQRTHREGGSTVFLAGSGLKGVLRSHAERLLRSNERHACDPTVTKNYEAGAACGSFRLNDPSRKDRTKRPHNGQCGACFTFGSLHLAGRFRIGDAYPSKGLEKETNLTEVRTGVGIDRRSQGAQKGVLYDSEVVVRGGFDVRLQGENFSLWQAGLVFAVLEDLNVGLIRIGGGKARGLGAVKVVGLTAELGFLDRSDGKLTGARAMGSPADDYGLPATDEIAAPPGGMASRRGLFRTMTYESSSSPSNTSAPVEGAESSGTVEALARALVDGPLARYLTRPGGR